MSAPDPIALAGAKAKGKRPWFFDDPMTERVLAIAMAVAGELAVCRERLDTLERLLAQRGLLRREDIDGYQPDEQAAAERMYWHKEYIARILRVVQQERERIDSEDRSMTAIADSFEEK